MSHDGGVVSSSFQNPRRKETTWPRDFRPAGCKSAHDILRYCHEKAIEAMFAVNDQELEDGLQTAKTLDTPLPLNISVLDLGGGLDKIVVILQTDDDAVLFAIVYTGLNIF